SLKNSALLVDFDRSLADGVPVLFPGRQVKGIWLELGRLITGLELLVRLLDLLSGNVIADLEISIARRGDADIVDDLAGVHLAIRRFYKPELVDPRKTRQRRYQSDVRTLRGLDRAYAAVVSRVDVPDLEPGPFARQPARPECRQPPLVSDLRKRVGLVHELRQLGRAKELPDRRGHRLGINQGARHGGLHLLMDGHLFLDRPFHPDQAQSELVLEQLADGADAAIAQVVDVVRLTNTLPHLQQVSDDVDEIDGRKRLLIEPFAFGDPELDVELEPADP